MKILVGIKRVIDFNVKVRVTADGARVDDEHVKMSINPFDEIAVEEAVRLKELGIATEIIVVSIGTTQCQETLRHALAMGADQAFLIETANHLEPFHVAHLLKSIAEQHQPQLILLGKQAIDDDCNQTGQMLAGLLNWPQATFASKLIINNATACVTREIDGGLETIEVQLPAVVTTDLRLNTPRYLSLPNIMKAKAKPITILTPQQLGVNMTPHVELLTVSTPPQRSTGIRVKTMAELINKLKTEAKVMA